jgi:hypothetical protein
LAPFLRDARRFAGVLLLPPILPSSAAAFDIHSWSYDNPSDLVC